MRRRTRWAAGKSKPTSLMPCEGGPQQQKKAYSDNRSRYISAMPVLIPSSSGQWLGRMGSLKNGGRLGLNPFFIRSMVRTETSANSSRNTRLNPFFIRSMVRTERRRFLYRGYRLNPFFIRSMVRTPVLKTYTMSLGLNPFFIRSMVRTLCRQRFPESVLFASQT